MKGEAVFLDTQFLLALINPEDAWHARALEKSALEAEAYVTTDAVRLEVADALCRHDRRALAARLLRELRADAAVECVSVDRELFDSALALYCERRDKDWSLTDCISFTVMKGRKLTAALTRTGTSSRRGAGVMEGAFRGGGMDDDRAGDRETPRSGRCAGLHTRCSSM
jgi:predicted nucleic acid-binding protein